MSDTDDVCVSVVLPAGGTGERCGSFMPKQFCPVMDRPIILYTLHAFHRLNCVKHIVVVVSESYMDYMEKLVKNHGYSKIMVVRGAKTRHRSVYNGVKALKLVLEPSDVVILHDAVRLFVDKSLIQEVAKACKETGAAGVHRPLLSTVIAPDERGYVHELLDRNIYRASEMPQGFIFSVILSAFEKANDHDFDSNTGCLHLALKYGVAKVKYIEGQHDHNLWKVTLRRDLYAAEGMLKEKELQVQLVGCCNRDLVKNLEQDFYARNLKMTVRDSVETCDLVDTNCTVYYYTQFDSDVITKYTENHKKQDGSVPLTPFMDKVIVHVIRSEDKVIDCGRKVTEALQAKIESWRKKHLLVYFVFSETKTSVAIVSKMVARVIWARDPVMAGQTYMAFD